MYRSLAVAILTAAMLAGPAAALELRGGPFSRVAANETIDDDLYIASGRVTIDGHVKGDLIAAGGTVRVRGQVDGDAMVAGGTVEIAGRVGESIRAAGGSVTVEGQVGGDVVVIGGEVEIVQEARVTRDVAVTGGAVLLRGSVGRNVIIGAGRVVIAGSVGGNVVVRGGEVVVESTAAIRGNLTYSSEQPVTVSPDARISGRVIQQPFPVRPMPSARATRGFRLVFGFVDFLWMMVLALAMVALVPQGVATTADALRARPWGSLGWGTLLLVGIPIVVVALVVTLVGIPIATLLLLAHFLALFVSHAAAALAIGRTIVSRASPYAQVTVGVVVVAIATNLPIAGVFLRLIVIALGMGAVAIAFWSRRQAPRRQAPTTTPLPGVAV